MGKLMPFNGNIDPKHIIKTKFSDSGKDVCWYFYKGKKLRMRAEVLLVDEDGKMYAHIKEKAWNAHACGYALPGGGLEHDDKDYAKCAAREAQEEARITPSPCIDTGIRYWVQYSNPENADSSPGALTILCIGKAGKRYTGYIAPEDRDSMLKGGDWYYPNDLPGFHKYHKQAYDMALHKFNIKQASIASMEEYVDTVVDYLMEGSTHSREPYRFHSGKFIVDIGNGTDPKKHDYCMVIQPDGSSVVVVKHGTNIIVFDGHRFVSKDFSHPLNHKKLASSDEAYAKMMYMVGKMVKKDARGRYFTDTRYKDYKIDEGEFDIVELYRIADTIKKSLR